MTDPVDPSEQNAVILRFLEQDEGAKDPKKIMALRELLRAGIPVGKAATHPDLEISVAWRMVTSNKKVQKALIDGDDFRRRQLRSMLEQKADDMLHVIVSLAHDTTGDPKVRLQAAQDILDRTGLLDKATGKGGKAGSGAGAVIEVSTIDKGFQDRLHRITVRAGAESSGD